MARWLGCTHGVRCVRLCTSFAGWWSADADPEVRGSGDAGVLCIRCDMRDCRWALALVRLVRDVDSGAESGPRGLKWAGLYGGRDNVMRAGAVVLMIVLLLLLFACYLYVVLSRGL